MSRQLLLMLALLGATLAPARADAPHFTFTHLAGSTGGGGKTDGQGTAARFRFPTGLAADGAGNLFVADTENHTIRKITADGVVSTLAGSPGQPGHADGTGSTARFDSPDSIAVDRAGNVLVADGFAVRKISPAGVVTTLAGGSFGTRDGIGSTAQFQSPGALALDPSDNLYLFDFDRIRKVAPDGTVTTLTLINADGQPVQLRLFNALAVDNSGTLFLADISATLTAPRFFRVSSTGTATLLSGLDIFGTIGGATGDAAGNIFVSTPFNGGKIYKIAPNGTATIIAEGLYATYGLAADVAGRVFASLANEQRIVRLTPNGTVERVAGLEAQLGSVDATGADARFSNPEHLAIDAAGNVFVADWADATIRKISPAGVVTTIASAANAVNPTSDPRLGFVTSVAIEASGSLLVTDQTNLVVRRIALDGTVSILAGSPGQSGKIDGTGAAARFDSLHGAALDATGNLYTATLSAIRKVSPTGVVTTLAGSLTETGSADGTGAAARFFQPFGLTVDGNGNVFVADSYNHTARKITPAGEVTTIAGTAGQSGSADGTGASARFAYPASVAVDRTGNLYVTDAGNQTIRFITPAGVVTTLAGKAGVAGADDGPDAEARFHSPAGIALDADGNLYVADAGNYAIRRGQLTASAPTIVEQPRSQTVVAGASVTFTVNATGRPNPSYQWQFNGTALAGATTRTLTLANVRAADAGDYSVVVANSAGTVTSNRATLSVTAAPAPSSGHHGGGAPSLGFGVTLLALTALRVARRRLF